MRSLVKFELGCGEMENRTISRSRRRQLNQVVLHEQVEKGATIKNNLNEHQVD
jgi:hypothetical protein